MIAIIDYGVGNLYSLKSSLKFLNIDNVVTNDKKIIQNADKLILPGVGAFGDAKLKLDDSGLTKVILDEVKNGKIILGICLGMQMLFDKSYEYGEHSGLGLIKGNIKALADDLPKNLKIPHMGWNSLDIRKNSKLLKYVSNGDYVYYVHSYYAKNCEESITSTSFYGTNVTGSVENKNVFGTQFHPEKSGNIGLKILRAFDEL